MFVHECELRVRYKETDNMGVVHHSNYAVYYEYARTEMLRECGLTYKGLEEQGVMMPVREISSVFVSPARYDDLLTIRTMLVESAGFKAVFEHEIFNQEGVKVNTGRVVLVYVDAATRRLVRAPEWFVEKMNEGMARLNG